MRVALVVTGGFDRSGRERIIPSLLWLVERLARRHEVVVYVLRYHDVPVRYMLAGATIRDLGRPQGLLAQFAALSRAMREDGPFDLVHGYWAQPAGRVVALAGQRLRIPSVVTLDSGEFVTLPQAGYGLQTTMRQRLAVAVAGRLASRVTVCSEFQARLARAHHLQPDIIPLGVDTSVFAARDRAPAGPPYRLLHVASLNPVKDQATLVRAMSHLVSSGLDVTLDLVGQDTLNGQVQRIVRDLRLEQRVTFRGFLATDQLVPLYHAAHLFVLTSLHEAAGVVLLEAASCGVPVVGSAVGYLADWSPAASTSVPPADPAALATAIQSLLADSERMRDTAAAAQRWARAHDANWTADRFEALYAELVTKRT